MSVATRTMRAAVAYDFGDVRVEEMEIPVPGPEEALVRVRCCGICSGDVTPWYIRKKCPVVMGHEPAGEIVEVGSRVEKFSVGDRVFFHHHAPCLKCHHCRRGNHSMCQTWRDSRILPGGAAEYVLVPRTNLEGDTLRLPDDMSWSDGTLVEPLACVVRAFHRARLQPGDRVAVMGLGVMGQMMVRLARHLGAGTLVGSDLVPFRLEKGLESGLDRAVDITRESFPAAVREATEGHGADLVLVCPTSPKSVLEGVECAGRGSKVLMFMGPEPGTPLTLDMNRIYFDEVDLISSYSCGPEDTREALRLIAQGVIHSGQVVTHRFPLEQVQEACDLTSQARDSLKVVLDLEPSRPERPGRPDCRGRGEGTGRCPGPDG